MDSSRLPAEAPRLDGQALTEFEVQEIQALGLNDLYFFVRGILGYPDVNKRVHGGLCDALDGRVDPYASWLRLCVLMPRTHFKTTVGTVGKTLQEIARDPNVRVLLGNETSLNSELMLGEIKDHFMQNAKLRAFYPYIVPRNINDTVWSKSEILVPRALIAREPTIMTIGVGGAVVSRHFNYMVFDDLIGEEALDSPAMMEKAIRWLNHSVSLLVAPASDRILLVGTRWAYNDLYAHAIEKMGFQVYKRKAVVLGPDGPEPLFKGRIPMSFFEGIIQTDPAQWAAQYANDPSDIMQADFQRSWLRFYTIAPDGDLRWVDHDGSIHIQSLAQLRIYVHVDPSMGDTLRADCSAVMVVGVNTHGQCFILDAWQQRIDPLNLTEKLFEVHDRWSPRVISIESTAFQKSLRYFTEREAQRRGVYLRIEDSKPSTHKSKEARIRGALQPYFSSGRMFVRASHTHFVEQYLAFGRTDDDHMMDALAQGPEFWKAPREDPGLQRTSTLAASILRGRLDYGLGGYGIGIGIP